MRNLRPYSGDALAAFDAIVTSKKPKWSQRLIARIRPILVRRYRDYALAAGSERFASMRPSRILKSHEKRALKRCYDDKVKALDALKANITQAQPVELRGECQYCCLDSPGTFDHYIPKALFPEFSVYPPNLVPCCDICNRTRGDRWLRNGERSHIHLYYDVIHEGRVLLEACFDFSSARPHATFELVGLSRRASIFTRRFARHCRELRLLTRFRAGAVRKMISIHESIWSWVTALGTPAMRVMDVLKRQATQEEKTHGVNHWEVALTRAAASSLDFVNFCITSEPSKVWRT